MKQFSKLSRQVRELHLSNLCQALAEQDAGDLSPEAAERVESLRQVGLLRVRS